MARTRLSHLPARLSTGIFIANSGWGKLRADEETAKRVHGTAVQAYPALGRVGPMVFIRVLGLTELLLGVALTVPFVSTTKAAAGLTAFAAGLLGLYARVPGMRLPGSWRPSPQGLAVAKDVWMAGIGLTLLADQASARLRRRVRRTPAA